MHLLITGATGHVGSRFVPRLLQRGDKVRVLVRQAERAEFLRQRGAEVVVSDLLQPETLAQAVAGVKAVIHLAAFFRGATPEETWRVNQEGSLALAQAALLAHVPRFVFASTTRVYGPGRGRPACEDDPPQPDHAYPESKAAAEQVLLDLHRARGLELRIVRLAFVYGEGDAHLANIAGWLRAWNPAKRLHMIHHTDVAQALMLALDTPGIDGRIYNAADDSPATTADLLTYLNEPIPQEAPPLADPWEGIVDTTPIQQELGFRPVHPSFQAARDAGAL
jgi:nucleoside-diphosphate-sugar epimerase